MTLEDIEFSAGRPGSDIPPPGLSLATGDPPSPSDDGRHHEHADDGPRSSPSLFLQDVSLTDRSDNQSSDRSPRSVATLFDSWNTMSKGSIAHGHATPQGNESPADSPTGAKPSTDPNAAEKASSLTSMPPGSPHSPIPGSEMASALTTPSASESAKNYPNGAHAPNDPTHAVSSPPGSHEKAPPTSPSTNGLTSETGHEGETGYDHSEDETGYHRYDDDTGCEDYEDETGSTNESGVSELGAHFMEKFDLRSAKRPPSPRW